MPVFVSLRKYVLLVLFISLSEIYLKSVPVWSLGISGELQNGQCMEFRSIKVNSNITSPLIMNSVLLAYINCKYNAFNMLQIMTIYVLSLTKTAICFSSKIMNIQDSMQTYILLYGLSDM